MAKAFEIKISKADQKYLDNFVKTFGTREGTRRLFKELVPVLNDLGMVIAGDISENELGGQKLNRRTGTLAKSIVGFAQMRNRIPAIVVGVIKGPALAYAAIHEFGGVIKPVKAKTLAMPIGARALTPAGIGKYESPRQFPGELTYLPIHRAKVVAGLIDESGEMQYLLLREVTIKAKHYLEAGVEKNIGLVTNTIAEFISQLIVRL